MYCMLKPPYFSEIGYNQLISLQTSMNALQVPTTAAGAMPLVQIPRDRSTALVFLDSPEMDKTVKVMKIIKAWCYVISAHKTFRSASMKYDIGDDLNVLLT